jgi:hypothetical protein
MSFVTSKVEKHRALIMIGACLAMYSLSDLSIMVSFIVGAGVALALNNAAVKLEAQGVTVDRLVEQFKHADETEKRRMAKDFSIWWLFAGVAVFVLIAFIR